MNYNFHTPLSHPAAPWKINIVEAIDGKQLFKECGLGLSKCSASHPCPIHNEYKEARNLIEKLFSSKKIIDLCEPVNCGIAYLIG